MTVQARTAAILGYDFGEDPAVVKYWAQSNFAALSAYQQQAVTEIVTAKETN